VCRPTLGDSIFASNDQSYAPATALGSLSNGQSGQGHCVTANDQGTGTAPNSSMLLMYRRHNSPTHYIKVIIHLLSSLNSLSDGQSGQGHCVTANDQGTGTAPNSSIAITHQLTTSKSSPNHKARFVRWTEWTKTSRPRMIKVRELRAQLINRQTHQLAHEVITQSQSSLSDGQSGQGQGHCVR
jgi:hypothetical protein